MSAAEKARSAAAWEKFGQGREKRHAEMLKIQAAAKSRYVKMEGRRQKEAA